MMRRGLLALAVLTLATVAEVQAHETTITNELPTFHYPPHNLPSALLSSTLFGLLGIGLAIFGFKLFDWLTPGSLQKEVFEKCNVAAAVLGAAVIIGVCAIMAAAVH